MRFTIRPLTEDDYSRYAELQNTFQTSPVTLEVIQARDKAFRGIKRRTIAVDEDGYGLGYGSCLRYEHERPGLFWISAVVDPQFWRQGVGTALYEDVLEFAVSNGATALGNNLRENSLEGNRFAEKHGFGIRRHLFESTVEISGPLPEYDPHIQALEEAGIRFTTYAEFPDDEAHRRMLHSLDSTTILDAPNLQGEPPEPFDAYVRYNIEARWFRPEGCLLALDGERWIGMALVGEITPGNFYNNCTGVLREYRGRGIALALKVLAIRYAHARGAPYLRTNNDSENAPMLAINNRLGYHPEPGWYLRERTL